MFSVDGRVLIFFITTINFVASQGFNSSVFPPGIPEDGRLDFTGLANKYGIKSEEYDVVTEDGYILKVFRVVGDTSKPVFLMHGTTATSDDFIIKGNSSLCADFFREGYDVWVGNLRGNRYSRRHVRLNPDLDRKAFWDFSLDEYALFDLPAMLDLVINKTGAPKMGLLGYSQGATVVYALLAARPEYNDRVNILMTQAPVLYAQYFGQPLLTVARLAPLFNVLAELFGVEEVAGYYSSLLKLVRFICTQGELGYDVCVRIFVFGEEGADEPESDHSFFPVILGHFPAGTSRKNLLHFGQMAIWRRFSRFDYGFIQNKIRYGTFTPPSYDISKVTAKVAFLLGQNDRVSTLKNAEEMSKRLPNVVRFTILEPKLWTHLDFVYAINANVYVNPKLIELLKTFAGY